MRSFIKSIIAIIVVLIALIECGFYIHKKRTEGTLQVLRMWKLNKAIMEIPYKNDPKHIGGHRFRI